MNLQEKIKLVQDKNSEIVKIKSEIDQISNGLFEDFITYIFDKHPKLNSFGWTQYTPYFNDGDTCVFYANTGYLKINDEYAEDSHWFSETNVLDWGTWNPNIRKYEGRIEEPNTEYDKDLVEAHNEISLFLQNFDDTFYLQKFGDHAEITLTKEGIDISDFDHE